MGKLTNLRPRLGGMVPRLGTLEAAQKVERLDWRKWYGTAEWAALRAFVLLRDLYTCQMCGAIGGRLVADHRRPHKGDRALFFDPGNVQTLCKSPCHDKHKQAMETAGLLD